jgi:hypothetical protein
MWPTADICEGVKALNGAGQLTDIRMHSGASFIQIFAPSGPIVAFNSTPAGGNARPQPLPKSSLRLRQAIALQISVVGDDLDAELPRS